ncbi:MAG: TIGR01458 family HAD-type hydrolase [Planctomycetota bacterium]
MADETRGVLIDLSGVLYVGDRAVPGAIDALGRLRDADVRLRFVTNTSRRTRADVVDKLRGLGYAIDTAEVFSAPLAARRAIQRQRLRPHLLVHPSVRADFDGLDSADPNAVVVGDAGERFDYDSLNAAFRVLVEDDGRPLISMGANRYFKDGDGGLSLDMGPFVEALAFAAGRKAMTVGKPAPAFFRDVLQDMGCKPATSVMIGDDLANDVGGAQAVGLTGVLVRTGKYRPADEHDDAVSPDAVVNDFAAAVDWLIG